jgi:hypothetical protein
MGLFGLKGRKAQPAKTTTPAVAPMSEDVYVPPPAGPEPTPLYAAAAAPSPAPMSEAPVSTSAITDDGKDAALLASSRQGDPMDPEEGDADLTVRSDYYKSQDGNKSFMQKMEERATVAAAGCLSLPLAYKIALAIGGAAGLLTIGLMMGGSSPVFPSNVNVAFVGNSYFYVNDLPRFMESMSHGHIFQDSCLHNSASILEIIMTGNGMWNKWATSEAMIGGVKWEREDGTVDYLYDMGACSVPQLLTGHDQLVTSGNALGAFVNDGENPCFQSEGYLEYQESFEYRGNWDFVVIADQAKRMAFDETRTEALAAFNYTYGPILKSKRIAPVIVQPHAYLSQSSNSTGLNDLPTFTALVREGAYVYKKYLNQRLGWFTHATVAPVGDAFLAVWEDNRSMYKKLFLDDGIHPSAFGTFLYGTVIYATMMGYMPKKGHVVVDNIQEELFSTARRLQASSSQAGFPTKDELAYLYKIAKKVWNGYKPKALKGVNTEAAAEEYLSSTVSDAEYNGQYVVDAYSGSSSYDYMYEQYQNGGNQNEQYQGYNGYNDYYEDYGNQNGNDNGAYGYDEENAAQQYQQYNSYGYGANDGSYGGNYGGNNNQQNNGNYGGNYGN